MIAAGGRNPERTSATGGLGPERWIVGLAGVWTIALALAVPRHDVVGWSDLLGGLAVAVAGAFLFRGTHRVRGTLAMILGAWLTVGSHLFAVHVGEGLASNNMIVGLAVTLVGFGLYGATDPDEPPERTEKGATPWTG